MGRPEPVGGTLLFPIDPDPYCKNWDQDREDNQVAMGNKASALRVIAKGINHLLANSCRVIFTGGYGGFVGSCIGDEEGRTLPSAGASLTPCFAHITPDWMDNARSREYTATVYPPSVDGDATAYYMQRSTWAPSTWTADSNTKSAETRTNRHPGSSAQEWSEVTTIERMVYERGNATDTPIEEGVNTVQEQYIFDLVIQEPVIPSLDTTVHEFTTFTSRSGDEIMNNFIDDARSKLDTLWANSGSMVGCWSAYGDGSGFSPESDPGAGNMGRTKRGIWVSNTGYLNIIDGCSSTRDEFSPGIYVHAEKTGVGTTANAGDNQVRVRCFFYGECSGGNGDIKFEGSSNITSNNVTYEIASGAGPDWFEAGNIHLDASILDSVSDDTTMNKIDVSAKVDNTGVDLKIYAVYLFSVNET